MPTDPSWAFAAVLTAHRQRPTNFGLETRPYKSGNTQQLLLLVVVFSFILAVHFWRGYYCTFCKDDDFYIHTSTLTILLYITVSSRVAHVQIIPVLYGFNRIVKIRIFAR